MRQLIIFLVLALLVSSCKKEDNPTAPAESKYGMISGKVTDTQTGQAIAKALIKTVPSTSSVMSDDAGLFKIENVVAGEYTVSAVKSGFDTSSIKVKVNPPNTTVADISIKIYDSLKAAKTGFIKGRVIDQQFNPIINAVVYTSPVTNTLTTDQQGNYLIRSVTPGQYTVTVVKGGYDTVSTKIQVLKGEYAIANFMMKLRDTAKLPTEGIITGVIVDAFTGLPLPGVNVYTDPASSSVMTDNTGKYTIKNVTPAKYKVTAVKTAYATSTANITVLAGKTAYCDFGMTTSYGRIVGKVSSAEDGSPLQGVMIKTTPGTMTVTTDASGNFEISKAAPGNYTINAEKSGFSAATVSVAVAAGITTTADISMKKP